MKHLTEDQRAYLEEHEREGWIIIAHLTCPGDADYDPDRPASDTPPSIRPIRLVMHRQLDTPTGTVMDVHRVDVMPDGTERVVPTIADYGPHDWD